MSIFDIILGVGILGLLAVMMFAIDNLMSKIKESHENIKSLNDRIDYTRKMINDCENRINLDIRDVQGEIGYNELFNEYSGYTYTSPSKSVHERISLLMDHLNLEIKEGEPSKTILVKKKATKKSK